MIFGGDIADPLGGAGGGVFSLIALLSLVDPTPLLEIIRAIPPPDITNLPAPCPSAIPPGAVLALGANANVVGNNISSASASAVRTFNFDVGHSARFTVFGAGSATLGFDDVFGEGGKDINDGGGLLSSFGLGGLFGKGEEETEEGAHQNLTEAPFSFIHTNLGYGPMNPDELVLFSPGLNTPHDHRGDGVRITDLSAPMRLVQASNVLGFGIAHLHTGTQIDQQPATIFPVSEALSDLIANNGLIPDAVMELVGGVLVDKALNGPALEIQPRDFDKIVIVLSKYNLIDTPLKVAVRRMVDRAVLDWEEGRTDEPKLVLVMYSRASIEVSAALRTWKADATTAGRCNGKVEGCLRDAVTVVTIGNGDRNYPDGPAYIHVSMHQDKLTSELGVTGARPQGGGADAVYLNAVSPFGPSTNNAHNFAVNGVQLLYVMLRHNHVTGLRELYDLATAAEGRRMDTPDNVDELVSATIVATRCLEWVWDPDKAAEDVAANLPSEEEAREILDGHFGEGTFESIAAANGAGVDEIRSQLYYECDGGSRQQGERVPVKGAQNASVDSEEEPVDSEQEQAPDALAKDSGALSRKGKPSPRTLVILFLLGLQSLFHH